jgi:hypothetical protein
MGLVLLGVASGAALYLACVAVVSLLAGGFSSAWWLGVVAVAACHQCSGFFSMRGYGASTTRAAVSLGITGIVLAAALFLVFYFPILLTSNVATALLGVCAAVSASVLALAYLRHRSGADNGCASSKR